VTDAPPAPLRTASWQVDAATLVPTRLRRVARPARRAQALLPAGLPGARRLVRGQLGGLFGVPALAADPGDTGPGLLGPGAASWRVLGEPSSIAGGVRSLLVQALHPLAMAGVAEHSRYRADPLARLAGTSAWVTVATFGTGRRVLAEARRVRAMHQRVVGTAPDGRPYAASDPDLLVWVSVALTSSLLATHELFGPTPLSTDEVDRFVDEQARAAALLDPRVELDAVDPDRLGGLDVDALPLLADLPRDRAGLAACLDGFRADALAETREAADAMDFLERVDLPGPVRPAYRVLLRGVAATLPVPAAITLGFAPRDGHVRRLGALLAAMRAATGGSPSRERARGRDPGSED
jgi:uncharacterized protein (DUF2236 family)